jgi:hypothetical protein
MKNFACMEGKTQFLLKSEDVKTCPMKSNFRISENVLNMIGSIKGSKKVFIVGTQMLLL